MQQQNTQTFQLENEQKKIGFFFHISLHRTQSSKGTHEKMFNIINYSGNANSNHNEISLCTSQ